MKKVVLLVFILLFCAATGQGLYHLKKGFSCRRIHSLGMAASQSWGKEVDEILTQPFYYVGRGRQCFAFASSDGQYILKFPRTDIYKIPLWARVLPFSSYRQTIEMERQCRESFVLGSFALAFDHLKEQTGVIALHIGQSQEKGKILNLVDALGCKHRLPLEKVSFVLQHKHPIWSKAFSDALQANDRARAEKILNALLLIVAERAQKGILNRDRSFLRNYGFDGERAYQIDVGSFFCKPELSPDAIYQKSIRDSLDPVQEWLAQKDPDMKLYLDQRLKEILSE